ncbi:MAG: hypothetical protein ABIY70_09080 [Capsulimonas sp.]|uniref:hypothetical protein n=1 Tax=Capsulimonas sp. TaxID=2494211 RepID=UPI003263F923
MNLHELIAAAVSKLPGLAAKLPEWIGGGLIGWGTAYHMKRMEARAEESKASIAEQGLDRRQLLQDAALMMNEQREMMDEQRSTMARLIAQNTELTNDNRQFTAAVDEYRQERKEQMERIQESQEKMQQLQTRLQGVYERLSLASASSQCADCPLRSGSPSQ